MRTPGRARIPWTFAALSPVEPPIVDRDIVTYAERDKSWREERMRMVEDRIRGTGLANFPLALATPTDSTAPLARPTL